MTYVISAIVVLGILIVVHEFGHFWMAKKMGVGVEKFSIGFGRPIIKRQWDETEFMVSWLPLGGYVKMVGDEEGEDAPPVENPEKAFNHKPPWRRALIISAGPLANLIFAAVVFAIIFMIGMEVPDTKISKVLDDSPAQRAGLVAGDRILEINGTTVENWSHLSTLIGDNAGERLDILLERPGGGRATLHITPEPKVAQTIFGEEITVGRIGIAPDFIQKSYNPIAAIGLGFQKTWELIELTGLVVWKMVNAEISAKTIGGPLMIMKVAGDKAEAGIIPLLTFIGVLSVNLGILNLLPVPILDGGHLAFLAVESVKGSPVSLKGREMAQQVGLFLLIMLMVFVFYNDINRFITGG